MLINLEMHYGKRTFLIKCLRWDKLNNAWIASGTANCGFKRPAQIRLTSVIYWLRTGKKLRRGQVLHHEDHNPCNNRWANLQLSTRAKHARIHHKGTRKSASTRRRMRKSALVWARTPSNRRRMRERAKRQHREKNFGAWTWKQSRG